MFSSIQLLEQVTRSCILRWESNKRKVALSVTMCCLRSEGPEADSETRRKGGAEKKGKFRANNQEVTCVVPWPDLLEEPGQPCQAHGPWLGSFRMDIIQFIICLQVFPEVLMSGHGMCEWQGRLWRTKSSGEQDRCLDSYHRPQQETATHCKSHLLVQPDGKHYLLPWMVYSLTY